MFHLRTSSRSKQAWTGKTVCFFILQMLFLSSEHGKRLAKRRLKKGIYSLEATCLKKISTGDDSFD